ncbi:calcium-activated potassium channel subunit beta-2 isoform X1 [Lepisosteus oculatus]
MPTEEDFSFGGSRRQARSPQQPSRTRTRPVSARPRGTSRSMFLWTGSRTAQGPGPERRTIYQKIREHDLLDKRKTVTALRAGEDRAMLLGISMMGFSVMTYFLLGITVVRSYTESIWTGESNCTVLNSSIVADVNCSYSCGSDCWKGSRYPCLQVFVMLNSSGKAARLSHNEEMQELNPECFFVPKCRKDYSVAQTIIRNISERLKVHQHFPCYYDPGEGQASVLLTRLHGRRAVLLSLLWPSCTLLGGALIVALVKLTQHLSILCEHINKIKRNKKWPEEMLRRHYSTSSCHERA